MKTNQRSSRCGGSGVGYEGKVCTCCKQPLFEFRTVCVSCVRKAVKRVMDLRAPNYV